MSRNWGLKSKQGKEVDLGTQLCYWLFDVFYTAFNSYEAAQSLVALDGVPKPNKEENVCTIHIEGDHSLLSEPFFGSGTVTGMKQPHGLVTKNFSDQGLMYRSCFTSELVFLLDQLDKPTLFWILCYEYEIFEEILADPDKLKIALEIGQKLQDKHLVDYDNNGAGVTFVLVKLNLHNQFLSLLSQSK